MIYKSHIKIKDLPDQMMTYEFCKNLIIQCGLKSIPTTFRTDKLCSFAVNHNGWFLQDVPEELKTYNICSLAVKNHGCALTLVPSQYLTVELCTEACKQNEYAIECVPDNIKSQMHEYLIN
jgi:hypothetical protein